MTGTWLLLRPVPPAPSWHGCSPPRHVWEGSWEFSSEEYVPDGQVGDIWQCDCGQYWLHAAAEPWDVWVRIKARRARRLIRRAKKARGIS